MKCINYTDIWRAKYRKRVNITRPDYKSSEFTGQYGNTAIELSDDPLKDVLSHPFLKIK